jgi:hypothetical protein
MPGTTTRAGLRYPLGSEDNDTVLAMTNLATDVDAAMAMMSQGLISARGTANKGRKFYWATDDRGGKMFYDDGAAWQEIGPSPVAGPVTGYTGLISSAPSAALSDVTLAARAKTSQTGDIFQAQDPTGATPYVKIGNTGLLTANAGVAIPDGQNIALGTTTGTKIGTNFLQKLAFFNLTPIAQPSGTMEIGTVLQQLGLRQGGGYSIITSGILQLDSGSLITLADGVNIMAGPTVGTKIGTATNQKIGFWGATPITRPTISGSRGGNAALASLLTQMALAGLITDSTTA